MSKPVQDQQERPESWIGDRWRVLYCKTENPDPNAPYRQWEFESIHSGFLGIEPILDDFRDDEERMFALLMLIRAAPKMLTALDWIARNFPQMPHINRIRDLVDEAQWTQDEWFAKEDHG